jgi:hypothetical protein
MWIEYDSNEGQELEGLVHRLDEHVDAAWDACEALEEDARFAYLKEALNQWEQARQAQLLLVARFGSVPDEDLDEILRKERALVLHDFDDLAQHILPLRQWVDEQSEKAGERQTARLPSRVLPGPRPNPVIGKRRKKRN